MNVVCFTKKIAKVTVFVSGLKYPDYPEHVGLEAGFMVIWVPWNLGFPLDESRARNDALYFFTAHGMFELRMFNSYGKCRVYYIFNNTICP